MQSLILGAIAVFAGVLLGYWLGKASAQAEGRLLRERVAGLEAEKTAQAEAARSLQDLVTKLTGEVRATEAQIAAERDKYAQMQADLEKAFGDLAAKALSANNQSFLTLAKQELGGQTKDAEKTLEAKELAIKTMLDPLSATLKSLDEQTRAMEVKRSRRLLGSEDTGWDHAELDSRIAGCAEERDRAIDYGAACTEDTRQLGRTATEALR